MEQNRPQESKRLRRMRTVVEVAIVFSLLTMALGPLVRAEDAGLACPDWPLCHGKVAPWGRDYKVALEVVHRYFGFFSGLAMLAALSLTLRWPEIRRRLLWPMILATIHFLLQVLLGMWTITEQLDAYVVKSHLLNAVLFLAYLVYCRQKLLRLLRPEAAGVGDRLSMIAAGIFVGAVFIQIFLGGRVSANQAGLVCPAFPACYYEDVARGDGGVTQTPVYLPPMIGATEKHLSHRFGAYALLILAIVLIVQSEWRRWPPRQAKMAWFILSAILLQILIGALNVLHYVPVTITVLHSIVAYIIFLGAWMLWLEMRLERSPA
ncbi:MAG: COX15/CtaA family protein [Leptospirales bacterium]|nr:COX15/CtaA family protein [Leptospirales bacterium]